MNFCKVNEYELTLGLQKPSSGSGEFLLNVQTQRLPSLAKKKKEEKDAFIIQKVTGNAINQYLFGTECKSFRLMQL